MAFHSNISEEIVENCKIVSKFPYLPLKNLEKTGKIDEWNPIYSTVILLFLKEAAARTILNIQIRQFGYLPLSMDTFRITKTEQK